MSLLSSKPNYPLTKLNYSQEIIQKLPENANTINYEFITKPKPINSSKSH